jgi:Family of unknown function (DUF6481)
MAGFKQPDFIERQEAAAKARKLALEKFRAKIADPGLAKRLTARAARAAERSGIKTTREIERMEKKARAPTPRRWCVNARRKPNKRRPGMSVTPPANRDRSAGKVAPGLTTLAA